MGIRYLTDEEMRHIWIEVAAGRGRHGSFLTKLAEATATADPENFSLLRPLLRVVIDKYGLMKYLDNFAEPSHHTINAQA